MGQEGEIMHRGFAMQKVIGNDGSSCVEAFRSIIWCKHEIIGTTVFGQWGWKPTPACRGVFRCHPFPAENISPLWNTISKCNESGKQGPKKAVTSSCTDGEAGQPSLTRAKLRCQFSLSGRRKIMPTGFLGAHLQCPLQSSRKRQS